MDDCFTVTGEVVECHGGTYKVLRDKATCIDGVYVQEIVSIKKEDVIDIFDG